MATTPKTVKTFPLNSSAKDFNIPFEYLARKFVVVTLIGATRRELILNTEYRFTTATTITTTKAWGPSDNFTLIEIRRLTSASERLVDFADGSILRAYDLNISSVQSLHIAEEARDLTADTIGVNNDGNLDARARRIVNLADGVDDGDAVNLRQQKQWAGSALNQAQASAASAGASAASAAAALAQANASATSAGQSAAYRDTALTYRNAAETFKNAAETSNQNAAGHEANAYKWATNPEDQVVSGSSYSSLHYSIKSSKSATASAGSAVASGASATQAAASVVAAQAQADRAKTEADKLANFNGLAAAIDSVTGTGTGTVVTWKGEERTKGYGFRSMNDVEANFCFTKADGTDAIRLVRTADRVVQVYDDAQGSRVGFGVNGSTFPKTLSVSGLLTATGGITTPVNITAANVSASQNLTATGNVTAGSQFLAQIPPTGNNSSNVHFWMRNQDGTERALLYGDNAAQLHIRTNNGNGGEGITINAANYPTMNGLDVAHNATRQTTFFKSGVGLGAGTYGNCQLQLQASDGSYPALGFHSAGRYAAALALNTDNNLYFAKNDGNVHLVLTTQTVMGQLAGLMTADVPGSLGFFNVSTGTTLGPNGVIGGGSLKWSSHNNVLNQTVNGSWRCLGYGNNGGSTLWVRYA